MNGFNFFYFRNKENEKDVMCVGFPSYEWPDNVPLEKLIANSSAILADGSPISSIELLKKYKYCSLYVDTSYDRLI